MFSIQIESVDSAAVNEPVNVRGKFRVPYDDSGITVRGAEVLKHIVLVVTRGGNYQTVTPFKDVVVFPDDVKEEENSCVGFFNFNVFDKILFDGEGDYYMLCSLGTLTSNIVKTTVR